MKKFIFKYILKIVSVLFEQAVEVTKIQNYIKKNVRNILQLMEEGRINKSLPESSASLNNIMVLSSELNFIKLASPSPELIDSGYGHHSVSSEKSENKFLLKTTT